MDKINPINLKQNNEINSIIDNFKSFLINELKNTTAYKIAKWISKYNEYLQYENKFLKQERYFSFKRGQIVRVNLGFNLGQEFGGTHYAVVINNNDSYWRSNIIVVPLTSKKDKKITSEKDDRIDIGNEIRSAIYKQLEKQSKDLLKELSQRVDLSNMSNDSISMSNDFAKRIDNFNNRVVEYNKMKNGSIILVGQLRVVSKIRIIKPKYVGDFLYGIKLSRSTLKKIEDKMTQIMF